jgi:Predicted transcriptional regulator
MEEIAGFVNGNVNRRKILEILESKGPTDAGRISKIARIIPSATDKILGELSSYNLIQKNEDKYSLTDEGKTAVDFIRAL